MDSIVKSREHDMEKRHSDDNSSSASSPDTLNGAGQTGLSKDGVVVAEKSRGVVQMDLLKDRLDTKYRVLLYGGFALLAYIMSLDQYTNRSYLTAATSVSFSAHSTLTTISSIKAVFQSVSQPPAAKIADTFGRLEAYALSLFLYALGYVVVASANSIYAYAVGNSIYILGITSLFLLQNIIIADISSLRNRVFWSIFPSLPGTINVWISGNVTQALLGANSENASNWRWGIGMFCILTPALATPILLTLGVGMRKHKARDVKVVAAASGSDQKPAFAKRLASVFWQLDLVGLVLLVAGAGMILVTITIANGKGSKWSDGHCIALLVVGGLCCIAFVLWERFGARHPLIPFSLLTNRTVIVCFLIALIHPAAGGVISAYFYTFLIVAGGQTTLSATRITSIAGFSGTWMAFFAGGVARYTRHLKPIVLFGFCVQVLAMGLMIRYRGPGSSQGDYAAVQVLRGIGSGCVGFPVQAAIQSVSKHEHVAAITAGYLTIYYLAGGIGSAIGGGIWTNTVPSRLLEYTGGNQVLATELFSNPIGAIRKYPVGTPAREALNRAQGEAQRILSVTGTCLVALGLIVALFLQNVKLTDEQSLASVERGGHPVESDDKVEMSKKDKVLASLGFQRRA